MGTEGSTAEQLATALGTVLGIDDVPVRLRAWDGSVAGPPGAPVVTVRDPRALRRLVWSPGQVGLGPTLVYSCAVWDSPGTGLDAAQEAKLDLVCRKLALRPGARLLDVGCGWGSLALHAAQRYGADVVGVTISTEQAALARERVAAAGLADRVEIRVQDYRDVPVGPFDAISSIGMAEHVGAGGMPAYVATLRDLLRPGGRLLNHAIAQNEGDPRSRNTFITRFVFPDGELLRLGD